MIVLAHENHNKWPNIAELHHFSRGFDHSNLAKYIRGFKYLPKI